MPIVCLYAGEHDDFTRDKKYAIFRCASGAEAQRWMRPRRAFDLQPAVSLPIRSMNNAAVLG